MKYVYVKSYDGIIVKIEKKYKNIQKCKIK